MLVLLSVFTRHLLMVIMGDRISRATFILNSTPGSVELVYLDCGNMLVVLHLHMLIALRYLNLKLFLRATNYGYTPRHNLAHSVWEHHVYSALCCSVLHQTDTHTGSEQPSQVTVELCINQIKSLQKYTDFGIKTYLLHVCSGIYFQNIT